MTDFNTLKAQQYPMQETYDLCETCEDTGYLVGDEGELVVCLDCEVKA